jgi:hypothetical protein
MRRLPPAYGRKPAHRAWGAPLLDLPDQLGGASDGNQHIIERARLAGCRGRLAGGRPGMPRRCRGGQQPCGSRDKPIDHHWPLSAAVGFQPRAAMHLSSTKWRVVARQLRSSAASLPTRPNFRRIAVGSEAVAILREAHAYERPPRSFVVAHTPLVSVCPPGTRLIVPV